jgi:hypothetical protein
MKLGGLNGRRRWSVPGTCSGPDTTLIGNRLGLAPKSTAFTLKMVGCSRSVMVLLFLGVWTHGLQRRLCMDATRISDGRPVMLKRLVNEEGPWELQINRLFSTEPLSSNPRNYCEQLLDVIELPNDPPIMVHPLLRPFYDPPFQTYGEFVTFYSQVCEVGLPCSGIA